MVASLSESVRLSPHWQWQQWQGLPYLTCTLLDRWPHGFFTQGFYPRSPQELTEILHSGARAYRLQQVHGNRVLTPQEIEAEQTSLEDEDWPQGDGAIATQPKQGVWVASADCTPILIGDVLTGRVAALHAGWRGTAQKIISQAVSRFLTMGSVLENLRFALGPAIAGDVYQVSEQVAAEVAVTLVKSEYVGTVEAVIASLDALPESPILPDEKPGRVRLDVRKVNELQIKQLGVNENCLAIAPCCTYQEAEYFFSYRRSKAKKVQWSGIIHN
ncbi:peptidoglycan editing factor PgeF [Spirulina sp. CS-785/01]|uniref:peptidoglycan editing factor PgeF n=1 Tax=Spirulina sp. CS-785/01 TaxID=3021716 RepID=UPI00232FA98F|nr:peptidoglycan editing factor PgeF [Spirulina sp. CS-785/01]MDB9314729.1 peptidoglycan editing factor PgeF [Spirulina sp. CS-785/01]